MTGRESSLDLGVRIGVATAGDCGNNIFWDLRTHQTYVVEEPGSEDQGRLYIHKSTLGIEPNVRMAHVGIRVRSSRSIKKQVLFKDISGSTAVILWPLRHPGEVKGVESQRALSRDVKLIDAVNEANSISAHPSSLKDVQCYSDESHHYINASTGEVFYTGLQGIYATSQGFGKYKDYVLPYPVLLVGVGKKATQEERLRICRCTVGQFMTTYQRHQVPAPAGVPGRSSQVPRSSAAAGVGQKSAATQPLGGSKRGIGDSSAKEPPSKLPRWNVEEVLRVGSTPPVMEVKPRTSAAAESKGFKVPRSVTLPQVTFQATSCTKSDAVAQSSTTAVADMALLVQHPTEVPAGSLLSRPRGKHAEAMRIAAAMGKAALEESCQEEDDLLALIAEEVTTAQAPVSVSSGGIRPKRGNAGSRWDAPREQELFSYMDQPLYALVHAPLAKEKIKAEVSIKARALAQLMSVVIQGGAVRGINSGQLCARMLAPEILEVVKAVQHDGGGESIWLALRSLIQAELINLAGSNGVID